MGTGYGTASKWSSTRLDDRKLIRLSFINLRRSERQPFLAALVRLRPDLLGIVRSVREQLDILEPTIAELLGKERPSIRGGEPPVPD